MDMATKFQSLATVLSLRLDFMDRLGNWNKDIVWRVPDNILLFLISMGHSTDMGTIIFSFEKEAILW